MTKFSTLLAVVCWGSLVPLSAQIFSTSFIPSNVTGAPYSATQITERTEIRADGTQVKIPAEQ